MLPLCVTIGEPAGIGPDIILSTWANRKRLKLPAFFVIGCPAALASRALHLGLPVATATLDDGLKLPPLSRALPVLPLSASMKGKPGAPNSADAALVVEAIARGTELVLNGAASGLVTAPIAKEALYASGFSFPGHTEYLAELAMRHTGQACRAVMMIASDLLRTVPVTIHIPLKDVPAALTTDAIIQTAVIVARDLERRFGLREPRLAIAGLNPHAGENGSMGREDLEIVAPAVERLRGMGVTVLGPLPADTMFHARARSQYDAALCMYHDQALIPAKTLAFDEGVNVTLGLPFIRTSPDHGTAFSLAGTGEARPDSFIAALRMAAAMAAREHGK